jgi:hypothetical protein
MTDVSDRPSPARGARIDPPPATALGGIGGWVVIAVTLSAFAAVVGFVAMPFRAAVTLGDLFIKPGEITVASGSDVTDEEGRRHLSQVPDPLSAICRHRVRR